MLEKYLLYFGFVSEYRLNEGTILNLKDTIRQCLQIGIQLCNPPGRSGEIPGIPPEMSFFGGALPGCGCNETPYPIGNVLTKKRQIRPATQIGLLPICYR